MTEPILIPPVAGETIATISSYPELVEAFRTMKARLGLSNKWVDGTCDFADGVTDKLLGPSQTKNIGPLAFSMFCQVFAVKFRMEVDLDAVRKMEAHWEQREEGKVAFPPDRISKKLVEKAKPLVLKDFSKAGGKASGAKRTGSQGSEIMRRVAKKGWRKRRRTLREKKLERKGLLRPAEHV